MRIGRAQQDPELLPPEIPDIRLHGGINRTNIFPPPGRGALVLVNPLPLVAGDVISVYWQDGTLPAAQVVIAEAPNDPVLIDIPADRVRLFTGNIDVWYTVFTPTLGETYTSAIQPVIADFDVPGDPDPDQSTPFINENLAPIQGLDDGVVPGQPLRITIPRWKFTQRGDRLTVSWGAQNLPVVTIADDLGEAGPAVEIDVPWTVAGSGPAFVTYHVLDLVANHSLWAESVQVDVGTGGRHPAPDLLDTDDFGNLPIDELQFRPARVEVQYPRPVAGDVVVLTWSGLTKEGIALDPVTFSYTWPPTAPIKHTFSVPYAQVLPFVGGEVRASYTVQPAGTQPPPTPSAIARALVTGTPVTLPSPTVLEAVGGDLDPALLDEGATVQVRTDYAFATGADRITMFWRGESADGSLVVSLQQTRRNDEATNNLLDFVVPKDRIVQVAGGRATVRYEVLTPASVMVPSGELELNIREAIGVLPLPPPTVDGTAADNSLNPGDVGQTVIVRVPANAALPLDNSVFVTWLGTPGPGSAITAAQPVDRTGMRFEIDKSVLPPNAGLSVNVYYTLTSGGLPGPNSDVRVINVLEGDAIGNLPPPGVREAQAGQLDPLRAAQGCTVDLPLGADILPGDSIVVTFGGTSLPPGPGPSFIVPAADVARHLGQTVNVTYTVTRGAARKTSDVLPLQVLDIVSDDARIPRPLITEANGGFVLNLNQFVGDATALVPQWPLMAIGQTCWLRAIAAGTIQTLINGERVGSVAPIQRPLPRAWLEQLIDNTALTLELKIGFDGGGEATARTYTSPAYNVVRADWDLLFDFDAVIPPFPQLSSRDDQANPLRFPQVFDWRFDAATTLEQFIGVRTIQPPFAEDFYRNNVLRIGDDSGATNVSKRVLCTLAEGWTRVRFAVSVIDNPFTVSFQDANRVVIGRVLEFGASPRFREVISMDAGTQKIRYIEIRCVDTIHLDFFKFKR